MPKNSVNAFIKHSGLSLKQVAKLIYLSERTLQRYSPDKTIHFTSAERLIELTRLFHKGINVFNEKEKKLTGGRWNLKGFLLLYCGSTSSLAILEKLVHLDFDLLPDDLYFAELEVPENSIKIFPAEDLPKNWNKYPASDKLKLLGKDGF